jgi:hypothetical protein
MSKVIEKENMGGGHFICLDSRRPQVFLGPYPSHIAMIKDAKKIKEPHHYVFRKEVEGSTQGSLDL